MNLISRKEAREKLDLSDATFRRRLKELNIQCVTEILPNGIESKKLHYEDFLKLAEYSNKNIADEIKPNNEKKDLALYNSLKLELITTQLTLSNALKSLQEKDDAIKLLRDEKNNLEKMNNRLFDEFIDLNKKHTETVSKKSFFARLFGK